METSSLLVTVRQWTGVLLLSSLLIMGPIAAVTGASPAVNRPRPTTVTTQEVDLFVPDPLLVDTIAAFKDTMGMTTSVPYEQAEYLNAQAIIGTMVHTADRITAVSAVTVGTEVSGTTTLTISGQGLTAAIWLSDLDGIEEWTIILDSVVRIDDGFQLLGSFIHSVDRGVHGVIVSEESFEAILGFDGSLTMVGDIENLETLLDSLMEHVALAEGTRLANIGPIIGLGILGLAVVVVVCIVGWLTGWFSCVDVRRTIEFPAMDHRLTSSSLPYAMAA